MKESRDVAKLMKINVKNNTKEVEDLTTNFQRVYSLSYISSDEYLLAANTDGYSDLYVYKSENRHHIRITEDFYDDLDAEVIRYKNRPAVVFRSNRPDNTMEKNRIDTILPVQNFDLFLLRGLDKDAELVQLTDTEYINERLPFQSYENELTYLHGRSGIENAYTLDMTTGESLPLTNSERNIITHHCTLNANEHFYNYYYKGNYINILSDKNAESTKPHKTFYPLSA